MFQRLAMQWGVIGIQIVQACEVTKLKTNSISFVALLACKKNDEEFLYIGEF